MFKKMMKIYQKSSVWSKLLFWVFVILIICIVMQKHAPRREGFEQRENFIIKEGNDIYDKFYVDIYEDLVFSKIKNDYEVGEIIGATKPTEESILLDIGSGTGRHVAAFAKNGIKTIGIDSSPAMVEKKKKKYPALEFKVGDATEYTEFQPNTFTHITCLYFTIYYIENKLQFFKNCYEWLMPGGYLAIHLVNRDRFDPILPAGDPLVIVSPQKYAKKRITNTLVKFKDFKYKANFDLKKNDNIATFTEIFKDDATKKTRQNIHKLFMNTQKYILSLAKDAGFILLGKLDMISVAYDYQYIYILQKPE